MEEINVDLPVEESNTSGAETEEYHSTPTTAHTKKPRAIIIKATNRDFEEINDLLKSRFPDVQVLYVTTGPAASILRVTKCTKCTPFEVADPPEGLLYSVE